MPVCPVLRARTKASPRLEPAHAAGRKLCASRESAFTASFSPRTPMSEPSANPPIPEELLSAVLAVEDEHLREALEEHLVKLPDSMRDLGALLEAESWVDAMCEVLIMDEQRVRQLAAASVAVVAQELKNATGEFERWMAGGS